MLVQEWLVGNKLSPYLGKTESILFASMKTLRKNHDMDVTCNGNDTESGQVTYLGIHQVMTDNVETNQPLS